MGRECWTGSETLGKWERNVDLTNIAKIVGKIMN
jgi:hypothetical protein